MFPFDGNVSFNDLEIILKDAKLLIQSVIIYESFDVHYFDPTHSTSTLKHVNIMKFGFILFDRSNLRFIKLLLNATNTNTNGISIIFLFAHISRKNVENKIMSRVNYFLRCKNFSTRIKIRNFLPQRETQLETNDEHTGKLKL